MRTPPAASTASPYAMTCSAASATPRDFDPRHRVAAATPPFYPGYSKPPANAAAAAAAAAALADHRRATTHTMIVAFFVLLCLFSCAMTVALLYQSHAETHRQIEEVISDLRAFTDVVRDELAVKRALVDDYKTLRHQQQQLLRQQKRPSAANGNDELAATATDYDELQLGSGYADDDRFMGVDLDGNRRPSGARPRTEASAGTTAAGTTAAGTTVAGTVGGRRRRSAVIDVTKSVKNELNRSVPVESPLVPYLLAKTLDVVKAHTKFSRKFEEVLKTLFTGPVNEKSNVELIQVQESSEGNKVPMTHNQRKGKKMGANKNKMQQQEQMEEEEEEDTYENPKNKQLAIGAHFASDPSKYNIKTHPHYLGNGKIKHPDGNYRDWSQHVWNGNSNTNHFQLKNGVVEVSTPGVYFVYAQIYYSDQHDVNGYFVMKNDEKVLGCTTTRHQELHSDSCYTAGLIYFNAHDILSIRGVDLERYIILDPIKSFFGLFEVAKHFK